MVVPGEKVKHWRGAVDAGNSRSRRGGSNTALTVPVPVAHGFLHIVP